MWKAYTCTTDPCDHSVTGQHGGPASLERPGYVMQVDTVAGLFSRTVLCVCVKTPVTAESKTYETRPASFNLLNYGAKCYNIDVSWIDSNGVGWCS